MLTIHNKRHGPNGEWWLTKIDNDKWKWLFATLQSLTRQDDLDFFLQPTPAFQRDSDLGLTELPQYVCKIPAVIFFPYVTCIVESRLSGRNGPMFVIPQVPLNRLHGRYWLASLSAKQGQLIMEDKPRLRHGWIDKDSEYGIAEDDGTFGYLEVKRLSTAAESFLLDDIRFVYDESKHSRDMSKTNTTNRHCFGDEVVAFVATKEYLAWYIDCFNSLVDKLITMGKLKSQDKHENQVAREKCLLAGWTINRLAVDVLVMSSVDAPYIRKWQFFGFLDAVVALVNGLDGTGSNPSKDAAKFKKLLGKQFFVDELEPTLNQIPVSSIRDELVLHTRSQYDAIEKMKIGAQTGPELLWLYRNTRHGFLLGKSDNRKQILRHSGQVPNDLPDLAIALWHYVLLRFPFR